MKDKFVKVVTVMMASSGLLLNAGLANAATLSNANVGLSDSRPSQVASYTFTGSAVSTVSAIQCIKVTFSSSSTSVVTPTGFTAASATVNASSSTLINSSTSGWAPTATANTFSFVHATTGVTPLVGSAQTFVLDTVTNSSVAGTSYYYTIATFTNVDCATGPIDNATVQFINTNGSTLSLSVDSSLSFSVNSVSTSTSCAGSTTTSGSTATTIPFGTVTAAANGLVCQNLAAATNASNGYTIYIRDTGQLTNGIAETLADWTGTNAAPTTWSAAGTEAYGYSTNDDTLGTPTVGRFSSTGNLFAANSTSNAEVAYEAAGVTSGSYQIAHKAGISTLTHPGTYQTTVIYTCTPVY